MKHILFVHHSADMYGADKVLLSLVEGLNKSAFTPIVIVPETGPLVSALISAGIEVHIIPIVKVGRKTLSIPELIKLPLQILRSLHSIDKILAGRCVDIVHSNTLAILSGAFWARWKNKAHVWHVHEIIIQPRLVRKMYGWLLRLFSTKVVCISDATKLFILTEQPTLAEKTIVVWNGIVRDVPVDLTKSAKLRNDICLQNNECLVTLVGRINRWKGQVLLVEAATILEAQGIRNVKYLIVGSPPSGQEHFLSTLIAQVEKSPAAGKIIILPFTSDVWTVWDASDVVIIPSTEPEPFGLVALEAMISKKPVIAANHGGLPEIVIDEETGLLVEPGNAEQLAEAILRLAHNADERTAFGKQGFRRAENLFSLEKHIAKMARVYLSISEA
jgi:glycosyltransferase involved in cell wall biosynthesis